MRHFEYIGIPSQFQGRVEGVGSQRPGDPGPYGDIMADLVKGQRACIGPDCQMDGGSRIAVCHPESPTGTCKPVDWNPDWVAKGRELALESERQIKNAEKWRSNTPIATITALRQEGVPGVVDVYKVFGYNRDLGLVWLADGENSKATDSQLVPEFKMAAKFPEWVAAKASLGKSSAGGSAVLPLLLGAAYLLLA